MPVVRIRNPLGLDGEAVRARLAQYAGDPELILGMYRRMLAGSGLDQEVKRTGVRLSEDLVAQLSDLAFKLNASAEALMFSILADVPIREPVQSKPEPKAEPEPKRTGYQKERYVMADYPDDPNDPMSGGPDPERARLGALGKSHECKNQDDIDPETEVAPGVFKRDVNRWNALYAKPFKSGAEIRELEKLHDKLEEAGLL